jgi:fatty-acyl-CoA synthase
MSFVSADWVAHHARIKPACVALRDFDCGETRTWAELERRVGRLAHGLRHELRLGEGERVVSLTNGGLRCLEPKGAVCTHSTLLWQAINQLQLARVAEDGAHVFTSMPLFHAGGLNVLVNPVLFFGGEVTVSARFEAAAAARYIMNPANGVTHLAMISLMYEAMSKMPEFAQGDLSHVRTAICGGARLSASLHRCYADKNLLLMTQYGGTETGPTITAIDPRRVDKVLAGSCGQKVMHTELRLVKDDGRDAGSGELGEVWVRGGAITPQYYGARQPALDNDGWFHTGDVARFDDEAFYYIVDRLKDMYKSGGENVSTQEVELVLLEHPAVAEVAVIGVHHDKWNEVGLAIVVPAAGREVTLETLAGVCEGKLARYKHPKHLVVVDTLPRNVTGKVAKDRLRALYADAKWTRADCAFSSEGAD